MADLADICYVHGAAVFPVEKLQVLLNPPPPVALTYKRALLHGPGQRSSDTSGPRQAAPAIVS